MAPRKIPLLSEDTPELTKIGTHPYYRLGLGIVCQAFADLRRTAEVERALDAFIWLLYGDAAIILNAIGLEYDHDDLIRAIGRLSNGGQNPFSIR